MLVRQSATRRTADPLSDSAVTAIATKGARRLWMWAYRFIEPEPGMTAPPLDEHEPEAELGGTPHQRDP